MAEHPCIAEVLEALDGQVTKRQIQNDINRLKNAGVPDWQLSQKAIEFAEERLRKAWLRKRNTALLIQAESKMTDYIRTNFPDDPVRGMQAYILGIQSDVAGSRASVFSRQESITHELTNGLMNDLNRAGLWEYFTQGTKKEMYRREIEVAKELGDLHKSKPTGMATKNQNAKDIAKIIHKWQEYAKEQANKAGADIRDLDGYIMTQTHDMFKLRKAKDEGGEWKAFVRQRIDMKRTFGEDLSPEEMEEAFDEAFKTLSAGHEFLAKTEDPILAPVDRTQNVGGTMSKHRKLHFKGAKEAMEYNRRYGSGSMRENILANFESMGKRTGLMEMMGPNPGEVFDRAINRLGELSDVKQAQKLADKKKALEKAMAVVDGSTNIPGNAMAAKAWQIFRAVQSMSKLGGAVVSAISDIPLAASELRYQGEGFLDAYRSSLIGSYNSIPKAYRRELAMAMGIFFDGQTASMTYRLSGREDFSGRSSRALGTFFKYTGLQPWTDRMRQNAALAMGGRLGMASEHSWSSLDPDLKRTLNLFNIGEDDWGVLSRAVEVVEDTKFMTPERVMELDDIPLEKRREIAGKLREYYIDRVDHAVINPDGRTLAMMKQGTRPGTVDGELFRLIGQFKAFPVAVIQKVLGREIHGRGQGGWKTGSGMMGLAHVVAMTTAFGYVAMSAKDLLKGREPRDPRDAGTWAAAMLQGGALGLYGDFLLGNTSRFGQSLTQSLAGPGIGTLEDTAEFLMAIRDGDDPGAKGVKLLTSNTPFLNVFYTKAALDYLILYRIQESMSPGYLRRMERTIKKNNNQEFMVEPSSVIPYGGF